MHRCEEFRERITEHIIDREDVTRQAEFQNELLICSSCSEFYAESSEMIEALSSVDLSISENQWNRIEHRLRASIINEDVGQERVRSQTNSQGTAARDRVRSPIGASVWVAASALLLITMGLARLAIPVASVQPPVESLPVFYADHAVPLDPVTVDFLE